MNKSWIGYIQGQNSINNWRKYFDMKFIIAEKYKSLTPFKIDLPMLVILTGLNGSGKTQFLQAVENGNVSLSPNINRVDGSINYVSLAHIIPHEGQSMFSDIRNAYESLSERYNSFKDRYKNGEKIQFETIFDNTNTRLVLETIAKKVDKDILNLSTEDIHIHYPLADNLQSNIFSHSFSRVFKNYIDRFDYNRYNLYRNEKYQSDFKCLADEEFFQIYGDPPWELVNEMFEKANLDFSVTYPSLNADRDTSFRVKLINKISGAEVKFEDVSSGEKIIMSLTLALFNSQFDVQFPKILLMDEPDASLHPSMTKQFLNVIENVLVKERRVRVIITTHSPSTVALAPEESLFIMNKKGKRIEKTTKDKALKILTTGVPSLSINYEHRRQVFVESKIDVFIYGKIYEKVKHKLITEISLDFISSGNSRNGGCTRVKEIVNTLTKFGNKYVFGIVDWDCKNRGNDYIKVLGKGKRYSIENYIFDPLLVAAYLLREKHIKRQYIGLTNENYTDFKDLSSAQLQFISDFITNKIKQLVSITADTKTIVKYSDSFEIEVPDWYLKYQGHELEELVKQAFKPLQKFQKQTELKKEIVNKVIDDVPELIPSDILDLFQELQSS